jgi:hypothetical protein
MRGVIQIMSKFYALVGVALMIVLPARMIWLHGRTWECGPHGLPVSILSPDGRTYRDGSEIDPYSNAIIRSGMEEPLFIAWAAFMCWSAYELRRCKHVRDINAQHRESEAWLALAKRCEQEGRPQEAQRAYASYWQSIEAEMALWLSRRSTRRMMEEARRSIGRTG